MCALLDLGEPACLEARLSFPMRAQRPKRRKVLVSLAPPWLASCRLLWVCVPLARPIAERVRVRNAVGTFVSEAGIPTRCSALVPAGRHPKIQKRKKGSRHKPKERRKPSLLKSCPRLRLPLSALDWVEHGLRHFGHISSASADRADRSRQTFL